jgi:hypothetical protein
MTDFSSDGMTRVAFVPTIANIALPTVSELNAGTILTSAITGDGLIGFEANTADVDTTGLNSTFDTTTIGRDSFQGTMLRLKKQLTGDTVYNTLQPRGLVCYIVIRRDIVETTAWASSQAVEVYPVTLGPRRRLAPIANNVTKYEVNTKINSAPNLLAAVA